MTLIQRNVEQLRREGIKNFKQFKEQKNFYDTDQALTEFEDMLQSNHLITHKSKYLEYLKTSGRDDYDSFQIRTLGKFLSEVINDIKIAYEIKVEKMRHIQNKSNTQTKKITANISIDKNLYEQFKRVAQKDMRKYSNIVEGSMRRYVQSKI